MYTSEFDYYRAKSIDEALSLLKEHKGSSLLAGGHSLIPVMKLRLARPSALIDIGRIKELNGINGSNGTVSVGALTTHAVIAASDKVPAALSEAAGMVGDPQVRNRGTIGGNVAHADPASDLPAVLVALGATINIVGPEGERSVNAKDFFKGLFETDLKDGEILTSVDVPSHGANTGSAYAKLPNQASRYAMVGAAAVITIEKDVCESCSVSVGGLTHMATKTPSVAAALKGKKVTDKLIAEAAQAVQGDLGDDLLGDMHASVEYRKAMVTVFVTQALTSAADRAK